MRNHLRNYKSLLGNWLRCPAPDRLHWIYAEISGEKVYSSGGQPVRLKPESLLP
jgi:hypothetical protein